MAISGRRVTILDVAELAGVSRQTVTRAMHDMPGINASTKERVLASARELGYRPSRFGRGLVHHDQHTLGLVIDNLMNPYYPELAAAVVAQARAHGWTVLLLDCSEAQDQREMITDMADQFDALIGYLAVSGQELDDLVPSVPAVTIDADPEADVPAGVEFAYQPAIGDAIEHLRKRGARRPVVLDSAAPGQVSDRANSFVRIAQDHGVNAPVVNANGDSLDAGIEGAQQILESMPDTDAIMCFNDVSAFGVLKALRYASVEVPGQIRVIGIDGLTAGRYVTPQLTTLAIDMPEVAEAAMEIVLARLDGSIPAGSPKAHRRVRHRLVVQEST